MRKKYMAITIWTVVIASIIGGCAPTGQPTISEVPKADQPTDEVPEEPPQADPAQAAEEMAEIKFVGFAGSAGAFEARAEEFMKSHPNINVTVQGVPSNSWAELMQAIAINIAGGDIPDVADIATEGIRAFAENGIITPLDDFLARDQEELQPLLDQIHPNLLNSAVVDDKTYGLPTVWNTMVLYYNKNVLREAGVEPPTEGWTLDDFLQICEDVVAGNTGGPDDTWCYAFANGYFLTHVPWMLVNDSNVLTDDWSQSRLAEPNTIEAMQLLHDFVYKYKISPKLDVGVSDFDLFVQNKLAFMGAGMWHVNSLKLAEFNPDDYDVINFPTIRTSNQIMGVGTAPIFVASENQDAAWEFAKFLSGLEFQESFIVADGWSIPSAYSAFELLMARDDFPDNGAIFYEAAENGILVPSPQEYGLIESVLVREFSAAMANAKTMEEAMLAAHQEISDALASRDQ